MRRESALYTEKVTVRFSDNQLVKMQEIADGEGLTLSTFIRVVLKLYLAQYSGLHPVGGGASCPR